MFSLLGFFWFYGFRSLCGVGIGMIGVGVDGWMRVITVVVVFDEIIVIVIIIIIIIIVIMIIIIIITLITSNFFLHLKQH
jgi:hypothetical protein